ncbi:MAG TPA: hypothetical protein VHK90_11820 [Thermoanaerobaculia bacterium]|nr:hypothetical protein [Thermoanaerobaculia bacterium]
MRLLLRSRSANLLLAVTGGIYALSAIAVLVWFVMDLAAARASTLDRLLQFALLVAAACGIWFIVIGLENLGIRFHSRGTSKPASIQR